MAYHPENGHPVFVTKLQHTHIHVNLEPQITCYLQLDRCFVYQKDFQQIENSVRFRDVIFPMGVRPVPDGKTTRRVTVQRERSRRDIEGRTKGRRVMRTNQSASIRIPAQVQRYPNQLKNKNRTVNLVYFFVKFDESEFNNILK